MPNHFSDDFTVLSEAIARLADVVDEGNAEGLAGTRTKLAIWCRGRESQIERSIQISPHKKEQYQPLADRFGALAATLDHTIKRLPLD